MRRSLSAIAALMFVTASGVTADDLSVNVSPRADFATLKTFALSSAQVVSRRPEFDNPLFVKKMNATIRAVLISKGLKESGAAPDLTIDYVLTNEEVNTVASRPRRPLRMTTGTLVVDMKRPGQFEPVWRGVYRDEELAGGRLVKHVFAGAKSLVGRYPRLTR